MNGNAFLSLSKLSGNGRILQAARHNLRALPPEVDRAGSIAPARSHLNECLHGPPTPEVIAIQAKALISAALGNKKPRKDAVLCVEVVFSLPATHRLPDDRQYFERCWRWAADEFGGMENILSVVVHRDEAMPHCHLLVLPLLNGRLNASKMLGYKAAFAERQTRFHEQVAHSFGLGRAPNALSRAQRVMAGRTVRQCMEARQDPALSSAAWSAIRQAIEMNPLPFLQLLGLPVPEAEPRRRQKSMAEIFTSPGKGPKKDLNSIDFAAGSTDDCVTPQEEDPMRSLSCVDFAVEQRTLGHAPAQQNPLYAETGMGRVGQLTLAPHGETPD